MVSLGQGEGCTNLVTNERVVLIVHETETKQGVPRVPAPLPAVLAAVDRAATARAGDGRLMGEKRIRLLREGEGTGEGRERGGQREGEEGEGG